MYAALADHYDKFTHNDCDYVSWSQYLFGLATKHNAKTVVDIACGTGKMTALLANFGLKTLGVDSSAEMLTVATGKCRNATFVAQDMKKLALPHKMDMAVCVNDGVNYLPQSALVGFFRQVAANLKSGAPFVFDLSSPHKLQNVLGNNVFFVDEEDATLLWSNAYKSGKVTMNLTLFVKNANGTYTRQEETHLQHAHSNQTVVDALQQAGFVLQQVSAEYGKKLTPNALRITYYATKGN